MSVAAESISTMTYNTPNPNVPYPPQSRPYQSPSVEPGKNTPGLIALILAIVGFIFACIPGALIIGWILLPAAFILSIVGLTRAGRKKGTSIAALVLSVVGTIVGFTVFATLVSGAVDDAIDSAGGGDFEPSTSVDDSDSAANTEVDAAQDESVEDADSENEGAKDEASDTAQPGSRDNPFPIGEEVSNDDWTISLGDPYEATEAVLDENPFNDEPEEGFEYWIVPVSATYEGADAERPGMALNVKFVSDEGHTYNSYDPTCGAISDDLFDVNELYAGATGEGNVCIPVPEGAPGLWNFSTTFGDPVFFAAD